MIYKNCIRFFFNFGEIIKATVLSVSFILTSWLTHLLTCVLEGHACQPHISIKKVVMFASTKLFGPIRLASADYRSRITKQEINLHSNTVCNLF